MAEMCSIWSEPSTSIHLCMKVTSEGFDKSVYLLRIVWAFAAPRLDMYQNLHLLVHSEEYIWGFPRLDFGPNIGPFSIKN